MPNVQDLNICLIGSWMKRILQHEDRLWKQVVDAKYKIHDPNVFCCKEGNTSYFWKVVIKYGFRWNVGKGNRIRFWEATWFGTAPLGPLLYFE